MNKDDKARVQKYLQQYSTLTLATSQDDKPWAATVFFVSDSDLNLYFVSDYRTHHGGDMAQNSRVAATINPCLLYTSPSPRDAHESRMPSSA